MPGPSDPQLLTGSYAPIHDETTLADLSVVGSLPPHLSGQFVRIGPNPVTPPSLPCDWRRLGTEGVVGPAAGLVDSVATNLVPFAGRLFALGEGALAYELDEGLRTIA